MLHLAASELHLQRLHKTLNWLSGLKSLTLKAPNKKCSRRHFNFLSFKENKAFKHQVLFSLKNNEKNIYVVVVLLFYVHGKNLKSCRDGQLT